MDSGQQTQQRIIEAAGEIFADSGYSHTTVRAICRHARVNVAAVNYHFGSKKNLYLAVLKMLRARTIEEHPFDLRDLHSGSPDERLRAFVLVFLFRMLDQGSGARFAKLMARELLQPTDAFDEVIEEIITPAFVFLSATVRQLFGKPITEEKAGLCCLSVISQIFYFQMSTHVIHKLFGRASFTAREIEAVADHITRFCLYAIGRMSAQAEGDIA